MSGGLIIGRTGTARQEQNFRHLFGVHAMYGKNTPVVPCTLLLTSGDRQVTPKEYGREESFA